MVLVLLILLILFNCSYCLEVAYTENLTQFKDKHFNIRTQLLAGCWLYTRDYLEQKGISNIDEETVYIVKECLKNIKRKDAILKITSLAQRNVEPVKDFSLIVNFENLSRSVKTDKEITQFDIYLLEQIGKYQTDFQQVTSKGKIKDQIEEQLVKRQYYFGIIPISMFSHAAILVTLTIAMMCCCLWCRSYKTTVQQKIEEKKKKKEAERQKEKQIEKKKLLIEKEKKKLNYRRKDENMKKFQ